MAVIKPTQSKVVATREAATTVTVKSVVGLMIHPFTQVRFEDEPVQGVEIDWWIKNQVEAGKLTYVTE